MPEPDQPGFSTLADLFDAVPGYQRLAAATGPSGLSTEALFGELRHLAGYLVDCADRGETGDFGRFFAALEEQIRDCSIEVLDFLVWGLIEHLQNIASHHECGVAFFRRWLGPNSTAAWNQVDRYWQEVGPWRLALDHDRGRPREREGPAFDPRDALAKVSNPELRALIESLYRGDDK